MLGFLGWSSTKKSSRRDNLDDELNQHLPFSSTQSQTSHSSRSYKTSPSQISISAPIPRPNTSLTGFDTPYSSGNSNELWQFRPPTSSLTMLGSSLNPASSSSTSLVRMGMSNQPKQVPHHLPSPPLSDDGELPASINDGPLPAVIRIETSVPSRPDSRRPRLEAPTMMRRSVSSPPTPTSPYHNSPVDSSSSSSEITPSSIPSGASQSGFGQNGRWNLKLHTDHPIYSESTQSLPSSSANPNPPAHWQSLGMHSDPLLASDRDNGFEQFAYAYSYPMVKQLSPIAEQEYFSPESLKRTKSLPPSSRSGSDKDLRVSGESPTHDSASPIGSLTASELTRPSPIHASPFISRQLNRTASQTSSRTHISATSSGPRQSAKSDNPPSIPPLDLRPAFLGTQPNQASPTTLRSGKPFANLMPSILGSTEGDELDDEYAGTTDFTTESLHAESFVTADSDELARPKRTHSHSPREIEIVDKVTMRNGSNYRGVETASVHSVGSKVLSPPSANESFITRRWERDAALGPGVPTFRAKKHRMINVTPAFWSFWIGFLCPVLWLIGGWHFTSFGEQPPRLTFWEFYFNVGYWNELCCGGRNKKREMDHLRREGKKVVPPLPRWVAEKQSSELGRARLNDPKRSLKGISFGYPFISRPVVPVGMEDSFMQSLVKHTLNVLGKPNRIFDQLYGIKLREVRGRPEGPRRMFDPWIQRCRYALCYAMLCLALGLLVASTYLIIINTRKLK